MFTFEDFEKKRKASGQNFSEADLALARKDPDAGMSLLQYKMDYAAAPNDAARALAHRGAEQVRNRSGFSGGTDGSRFYQTESSVSFSEPAKPYEDKFGEAPVYEDPYREKKDQLMNAILNRQEFSYDPEKDPGARSYQKAYAREGKRAINNTLAAASAATGGQPSSYAVNAATQAGDYYAAKMADKMPELEDRAYARHMQNLSQNREDLNMVGRAGQEDFQQFLTKLNQHNTDRNFDFQKYLAQLNQGNTEKQFRFTESQAALDRQAQQRQEQLQMATLKANNGDFSGLEELGIDTSMAKAAARGGGGYTGSTGTTETGDTDTATDLSGTGLVDTLLDTYPDGMIPASVWSEITNQIPQEELTAMGFRRASQGGNPNGLLGRNQSLSMY